MPILGFARIPTAAALQLAVQSDPRTAGDLGYVVKSVLSEALGRDAIRPFKVTTWDEESIRVVGWMTEEGVQTKPSFHLELETAYWEATIGQELTLAVDFIPGVCVKTRDRETGKRTGPSYRDAFRGKPGETRIGSYTFWLRDRLNGEESGCEVAGLPRFKVAETIKVVRKGARGAPKKIPMGHGECTVKVRITDPVKFHAFMVAGIGRQRGLGFGSMLPTEALDVAA